MKFKVGDKVKFKKDLVMGKYYGGVEYLYGMDKATIYEVRRIIGDRLALVDNILLWYATPEMIEYVEDDKTPTITEHLVRGNKTIVKLSNGKVGIAQCSPEDKFDVYEGLRIATARAYGREVEEQKKDEPKKEEPKLEIWDRVRYKGAGGDFGEGTIVEICDLSALPYLVLFDKPNSSLHDGSYAAKNKYPLRCWWCFAKQLEKI